MKKPFFFLLIVLILDYHFILGQTHDIDLENFQEGQYFFNRNDFEDALGFYIRLLEKDSMQANFNFKAGECYLNIPGKEFIAVKYLERAIKKVVPKNQYKKNDFSEKSAPLHAYFYLGNAYRMANQLDKALEMYAIFIDSPYFWGNYNQNIVEKEIKSCERAKIIQDAPLDYIKANQGEGINSEFSEINPVISADGKSMVYIRQLKFYNAVFYSIADSNGWKKSVNINPEILSDGEFYPTGLSSHGDQMLLIKKGTEDNDIYFSTLVAGKWTAAAKYENMINTISDESFASFGADDKTIYLSSNRRESKGGYDIFVSHLTSDGQWGKPENIGKTINTEFDEQNPVFCGSNDILYFCSNGHYNMGGYDIFYSSKVDNKWKTPVNLGYPINNTRDNKWFYPIGEGKEGYYVISDPEGYGQDDIYRIKILSESILNPDEKKYD
jgi:tetratricopeptide (TPR) repeat protein